MSNLSQKKIHIHVKF